MASKVYTYHEYLLEEEKKKKRSSETSSYPVPDSAIVPPPGDKVTAYVKKHVKKLESVDFFPALFLH